MPPVVIPFVQSDTNYQLAVSIDGVPYVFDVTWNVRDNDGAGAFYFDMYEGDGTTLIAAGVKVVLGVSLGRRSSGAFFQNHTLTAIDTSGADLDANFDDLGRRVQVVCVTFA